MDTTGVFIMAFNNSTDASDVGKLIPEAQAGEILKNVPQQSAALSLFRRVPLSTRTMRQNVLSALPVAYWVNGDTGLKQTTEMAWSDVVMTVEEMAVIMPVPVNVIDDMSFDIWGEARPLIEEAMGRTLDSAVFFGINKPASWPAAILAGAVAAGNTVVWDAAATGPEKVDLIDDLMSEVESDGFDVNGFVTHRGFRGQLRKLRDANGVKLLDIANNEYEGAQIRYAMDGLWPDLTALNNPQMFAGDFTKGVIGIRKDITYEIFREGVITDNSTPPQIIFNLMQQDMVAMRVTFRVAWQVANPINRANTNAATRYPFAALVNPAA